MLKSMLWCKLKGVIVKEFCVRRVLETQEETWMRKTSFYYHIQLKKSGLGKVFIRYLVGAAVVGSFGQIFCLNGWKLEDDSESFCAAI
jgi:hypothetical protein